MVAQLVVFLVLLSVSSFAVCALSAGIGVHYLCVFALHSPFLVGISRRRFIFGGFSGGFRFMTNRSFLYPAVAGPSSQPFPEWVELSPVPIDGGITHCGQVYDEDRGDIWLVGGFQVPEGEEWPRANTIAGSL